VAGYKPTTANAEPDSLDGLNGLGVWATDAGMPPKRPFLGSQNSTYSTCSEVLAALSRDRVLGPSPASVFSLWLMLPRRPAICPPTYPVCMLDHRAETTSASPMLFIKVLDDR
jgi:hypothetical protein